MNQRGSLSNHRKSFSRKGAKDAKETFGSQRSNFASLRLCASNFFQASDPNTQFSRIQIHYLPYTRCSQNPLR